MLMRLHNHKPNQSQIVGVQPGTPDPCPIRRILPVAFHLHHLNLSGDIDSIIPWNYLQSDSDRTPPIGYLVVQTRTDMNWTMKTAGQWKIPAILQHSPCTENISFTGG
jgi:hypothetical protein